MIARLTLTETISVLAKNVGTGEISEVEFDQLRLRFFSDVANRIFRPVRIVNAHFDRAGEMIARHGKTRQIRTLDSLQLSVAILLPSTRTIDHFVCADQRLCDIAILEGVAVINPERPLERLTIPPGTAVFRPNLSPEGGLSFTLLGLNQTSGFRVARI
jgi:hypothetical protein